MSRTKIYRTPVVMAAICLFVGILLFGNSIRSAIAVGPDNYNHEVGVISGDGDSYTIGSGGDLRFVFDATLERFYGEGLLMVDEKSIDMDEDALVNSRANTIILLGQYLDDLPIGKHHLEALFPDEAQGFAQADFYVTKMESTSDQPEDVITVTYPYYAFIENPDAPWSSEYDALDTTDTIRYSDAYFDVASPGDHPELRAVSYALALAGFENQADGYPSDGSTPNLKLHTFLNELGFGNYRKWDISSEAEGHSIGVTIARKVLPSGQTLIVVAPRNYNYMTEWLSNFNVGMSGDHAGFSESAELIKERLDEYIYVNHLDDYKIWMVGYSRGGAVVDLVAKKVNESLSDYGMRADDFYVYTFGAPKASILESKYPNIHDVKDGNDLLLGYLFPSEWGFYNTGVYEEIHPADLNITTSVIDIADLADSSRAANILSDNEGLTRKIGSMNGRDYMDMWTKFVTENGLTREYFDTRVKPPLSAIMQVYQLRTLDKQSEVLDFMKSTENGIPGMITGNVIHDLLMNYGGDLSTFPVYLDLVKVLKGTADDADIDELATILYDYIGEYSDYEAKMSKVPTVTESEFGVIRDSLPQLVKSLSPLLVADARYTQETFGDNYSLYYTYTLVSNAENLVIGHIPESIMPILKSLIPVDDAQNNAESLEAEEDSVGKERPADNSFENDSTSEDALAPSTPFSEPEGALAPDTGRFSDRDALSARTNAAMQLFLIAMGATMTVCCVVYSLRISKNRREN